MSNVEAFGPVEITYINITNATFVCTNLNSSAIGNRNYESALLEAIQLHAQDPELLRSLVWASLLISISPSLNMAEPSSRIIRYTRALSMGYPAHTYPEASLGLDREAMVDYSRSAYRMSITYRLASRYMQAEARETSQCRSMRLL